MIETSPAEILREYFRSQGHASLPSEEGAWPCYTTSMADGDDVEDDCVGVFDMVPEKDGRLMTGLVVLHYGVTIRVRSRDYRTGWAKINQLAGLLDSMTDAPVSMSSSEAFVIENATRREGVNALGMESGTKRRYLFDTRYVLTLQEQ